MPDLRPILFVNGLLLAILSLAMLVPALVDGTLQNPEWGTFLGTSAFTLFVGGALTLTNRSADTRLSIRQAFLLVTSAWILIALFGSLPFIFSSLSMSFTDAFFEAMSGITTTGSTVIVGLESVPKGLLIWRAILQWLGGVGIVVIAIAILPMLRVGGMQILSLESSDTSEKVLPRAADIAFGIGGIYLLLTIVCAVFYWLFGMASFDAVAHAMTTIATGGFSTTDLSFAAYDKAGIQWTGILFMILGSLPFVLYLRTVRGDLTALLEDSQVRWFLGAVLVFVMVMITWLILDQRFAVGWSVRHAAFNIVSILTGTGYAASDFSLWGGFALTIFFFIMFVGGCAGSTTCGIKIFRFQILYATARVQFARLLQPHGVYIPYFNHRPISEEISNSVLGFFYLYIAVFALIAGLLGLIGLDFMTSLSGAATAISNVGPGLGGIIGPTGTFSSLPDSAKWVLAAGMLLGRLELFTVLVLFLPSYWRS